MAKPGDVLEHPLTGERLVWRKVTADTGGGLLQADLFAKPGASVAAEHVHPKQQERFEVLAGVLTLRLGGEERTLRPGDVAVVPAGQPHVWWNAGDEEVHLLAEVLPALRTEGFFETFFGWAAEGKTGRNGLPTPLRLAVLMREYEDEIRLAKPPFAVQTAMFGPLAVLGRLRGYRPYDPPPENGSRRSETSRPQDV